MRSLSKLQASTSALEASIIYALVRHGGMLTRQVARLCIGEHSANSERRVERICKKLKKEGLIRSGRISLPHRCGGAAALFWQTTRLGLQLMIMSDETLRKRLRYWSDRSGIATAYHTIGITDAEIKLRDLENADIGFKLEQYDFEPTCWRRSDWLRPDAFAVTTYKGETKNWYIEIDRGNERPKPVVMKCRRYKEYLRDAFHSGTYGNSPPKVLWVVTEDAKDSPELVQKHIESLRNSIDKNLENFAKVFEVIHEKDLVGEILGGDSHE